MSLAVNPGYMVRNLALSHPVRTPAMPSSMPAGKRPNIPPLKRLPGPDNELFERLGGLQRYIELMKRCWHQKAEARPTFTEVARELK